MKKIIYWLMASGVILLTACGKAEQAGNEIRQITHVPGEIVLTVWEGWACHEENDRILIENTTTGSSIMITDEDLSGIPGGNLIHIEDYVEAVLENLKTARDYTYHCQPAEKVQLWGKEYYGFGAEVEENNAVQQFYIRKTDEKMMVITITLFQEDTLDTVLSCISPAE